MATVALPISETALGARLAETRGRSLELAAPLSDADATVQSMEDASPAKWHLAHTTWFFETFVLSPNVPGYALFSADYPYLFNSYYEAAGPRHARPKRGLLTRPSLDEVRAYRAHVDEALQTALPGLDPAALSLVELGINHEGQHQELLLTDILHLFAQNPLEPVYSADAPVPAAEPTPHSWVAHEGGRVRTGHSGAGFAFDCESPAHDVLLGSYEIGSRLVTNAEWAAFIDDGGYRTPTLWLSDGWAWVQRCGIEAPLYWRRDDAGWTTFTLRGRRAVDPAAPVCHVSYFEADAFATWAGARLPREEEWEALGTDHRLAQRTGTCWQWTGSAFSPYPGFRPASGAVGEYNGKFMCGQFVLKGSSVATPPAHSRPSYRNFFYPHQRWQFTGLRLVRDIAGKKGTVTQ